MEFLLTFCSLFYFATRLAFAHTCHHLFQSLLQRTAEANAKQVYRDAEIPVNYFFTPSIELYAVVDKIRDDRDEVATAVVAVAVEEDYDHYREEAPILETVTFQDEHGYHSLTVKIKHPHRALTGTGTFSCKQDVVCNTLFASLKLCVDGNGNLPCLATLPDGRGYVMSSGKFQFLWVTNINEAFEEQINSLSWVIRAIFRTRPNTTGSDIDETVEGIEVQQTQLIFSLSEPEESTCSISLDKWANPVVRRYILTAVDLTHYPLLITRFFYPPAAPGILEKADVQAHS